MKLFATLFLALIFAVPSAHSTGCEVTTEKINLQSWYDGLNDKYFNDGLPTADVAYSFLEDQNEMGVMFQHENSYVIRIDPGWNPVSRVAIMTLLHEMCHVYVENRGGEFDAHGPKWHDCMRQLVEKGAFDNLW